METGDLPRFTKLIAALGAVFGREIDEALLFGFECGLEGLPIIAVERAVTKALREKRFMPTPAELRECSGEMSLADRAIRAWGELGKAIQRHGYYQSVVFDDAAITAAVRSCGGWTRVCSIESVEEYEKWFRKDFDRAYQAFCRTGVSREAGAPLIGQFDRENGLRGYGQKPPVLIRTGLPRLENQPNIVLDSPAPAIESPVRRGGADGIRSIGELASEIANR